MQPGKILNLEVPIKAYDDIQRSYWVTGPILVLETNEYDLTFLTNDVVLYTSHEELAVELEFNVA